MVFKLNKIEDKDVMKLSESTNQILYKIYFFFYEYFQIKKFIQVLNLHIGFTTI